MRYKRSNHHNNFKQFTKISSLLSVVFVKVFIMFLKKSGGTRERIVIKINQSVVITSSLLRFLKIVQRIFPVLLFVSSFLFIGGEERTKNMYFFATSVQNEKKSQSSWSVLG